VLPGTLIKPKPEPKPESKPESAPDLEIDPDLLSRAEELAAATPTTFRVGSFNVLGASHTNKGGNKPGWTPAPTRMSLALTALRAQEVDVVGLQEFEVSQLHMFNARTGGTWGVYPGLSAGRPAVRNSVAWREDTWAFVRGATVDIPYFHGNGQPIPYVLLKNLESGREVYFINTHNPASTKGRGDNEPHRDAATTIQLNLANQLQTQGYPVVLTGDFNEREEVFCRVTGGGTMRSASGGSVGGGCAPPANVGIDWIFGSTDIEFSGYVRTRSGTVSRATDHPLVAANAVIAPPGPSLTRRGVSHVGPGVGRQ